MKPKFLLILSLFFLSAFTISSPSNQSTSRVIYKIDLYGEVEPIKEDENADEKKKNAIKYVNASVEKMKEVEYELLFNNHSSLYTLVDKVDKEDDFLYSIVSGLFGGEHLQYKNHQTLQKIQQVNMDGELLNVTMPFKQYDWTITKETKKIGDYTCFKATCEFSEENKIKDVVRTFNPVVWFTPEIPSAFGPKGLDGLPGLVLEASVNGKVYAYASSIDLNYTKKKIEIEEGGKEITKTEYSELLYNQIQDKIKN